MSQSRREEVLVLVRRRLTIINIAVLTIILGFAPLFGILYSDVNDGRYFFAATLFRNVTVTLSLILFMIALCRITRIVKDIRGAFPNRKRTFLHFFLVLFILSCNLGFLGYTFFYFFDNKSDSCSVTWQKIFYALDLLSFSWDLFELSLQALLLYIVLKYTAPIEPCNNSTVSSHVRVQDSAKERYNAHTRNMEKWEISALNRQTTNLDERIGRCFFSFMDETTNTVRNLSWLGSNGFDNYDDDSDDENHHLDESHDMITSSAASTEGEMRLQNTLKSFI